MYRTNLRIVDKFKNVVGEWYAVGNPQSVSDQVERAKRELANLQKNYPGDGLSSMTVV